MTTQRLRRAATLSICSLAGAGVALLGGCRESPQTAQAANAPLSAGEVRIDAGSGQLDYIRTEQPVVRNEQVIVALPAQVVMNENRTARVLTPVTGHVATLDANPGDEVLPGAPLAHIVSPDLAQAASDFAKARAAATQARAAVARAQDLYEHRVAALKDVEQARADNEQAQAELARARVRLTALGADTGGVSAHYVLRAPIAGVVVDRNVNPGSEVRPDAPTPLFTITSLDVVWLTANVYQRDLAAVHRGVTLRFTTDAVPARQFEATVSYVSGTLDPQTRTALVRATVPNADHALRPLEVGTARVLAPAPSPLLTVPTRALVTHGNGTVVYVELAPGRYARRSVVVTDDDGTVAVIRSGLSPTDRVVVDGSLLLEGEAPR